MTTDLKNMKSENKVEWEFGLQTLFDYDQTFTFLKRNFPMEGFLQESLGKALIPLPPKGFLTLPLHPAPWVSLLPLTGGCKVAHTQISLLGGATETAWSTPKESLIRKQKRKKKQYEISPNYFSTIPRCAWNFFPDLILREHSEPPCHARNTCWREKGKVTTPELPSRLPKRVFPFKFPNQTDNQEGWLQPPTIYLNSYLLISNRLVLFLSKQTTLVNTCNSQ